MASRRSSLSLEDLAFGDEALDAEQAAAAADTHTTDSVGMAAPDVVTAAASTEESQRAAPAFDAGDNPAGKDRA